MIYRLALIASFLVIVASEQHVRAQSVKAPPDMFKDLDDAIVGEALIINGKQLFIDDYVIGQLGGVKKVLNQPVKYPGNPLIIKDRPWEDAGPGYSTVIYDPDEKLFKLWYGFFIKGKKPSEQVLCYATSTDGIHWEKPIINKEAGNNTVVTPKLTGFQAAGIFIDPVETDPAKRYKMLFSAEPDGTDRTLSTHAAYSPDGLRWTAEPRNPVIPFSDTQSCPFWDTKRRRYVAHLRYGPPNRRLASRIESEDFVHWSPKVTLFQKTLLDAPFETEHYCMAVSPYADVYIGLLGAYHGETIKPIPKDQLWRDKSNIQLTYSRNGVTWMRVGENGVLTAGELKDADRDWKTKATKATFLPYGEHGKGWEWGATYPVYQPSLIVVDDQIRFYYVGHTGRHWASYHGDEEGVNGIGLATLRLDGFVSVEAGEQEGTLTTKPLVFIGDALEINASAEGGVIGVEALDLAGNVIEGFSQADCEPISTDSLRHVLKWKGSSDAHLLQARPIRLKFYIKNAKLFSFTPRILHEHYVPVPSG